MNATGGRPEENKQEDVDEGVRAPMQYQEDQLIGDDPFAILRQPPQQDAHSRRTGARTDIMRGGDADGIDQNPFIPRAQSARVRIRNPRPSDYKFSLDFHEDPGEDNEESGRPVRQQPRRTWGQWFSMIVQQVWYTFKLIVTLGGNIAPVGTE